MNKNIILDKQIVEDSWLHLSEDDAMPDGGNATVSYARWQQEKDSLNHFSGKLGIVVDGDSPIENLKDELSNFSLIAVQFAEFKDGRGYSLARLLRERYAYKGELRAIGNILRDQLFYLHRCGFNAFQLDEGRDLNEAVQAFSDFTASYQRAVA